MKNTYKSCFCFVTTLIGRDRAWQLTHEKNKQVARARCSYYFIAALSKRNYWSGRCMYCTVCTVEQYVFCALNTMYVGKTPKKMLRFVHYHPFSWMSFRLLSDNTTRLHTYLCVFIMAFVKCVFRVLFSSLSYDWLAHRILIIDLYFNDCLCKTIGLTSK